MSNFSTIFLFLFLFSCSNQTTDKNSGEGPIENKDTTKTQQIIQADTLTNQNMSAATDRFLKLVKFIDSLGYSFDTTRAYEFRNSEIRKSKSVKLLLIDNSVFYDIPYHATIPYYFSKELTNDTNHYQDEFYQKFLKSCVAFEKTQKIVGYFFTQKITTSNFRIDGMIEEWSFPDNNSAKHASEVLSDSDTQSILFFNCGAYVCYKDNYMYLFHTRAAGFMYSIKPIFKNFVMENNMTIASKASWKHY